jgi:hypothetical protein
MAGAFGVSAGVFLVFFMGEVPRVRNDILRQFPFLDTYFDRSLAPEDNVSVDFDSWLVLLSRHWLTVLQPF